MTDHLTTTDKEDPESNRGKEMNPARVSSPHPSETAISALQCQQQVTSELWAAQTPLIKHFLPVWYHKRLAK